MDLQLFIGLIMKAKQVLLGSRLLRFMNTSNQGLDYYTLGSLKNKDLDLFVTSLVVVAWMCIWGKGPSAPSNLNNSCWGPAC